MAINTAATTSAAIIIILFVDDFTFSSGKMSAMRQPYPPLR
jgi:hypothetical protein